MATKNESKALAAEKASAAGLFSAWDQTGLMERIAGIALGASANPERLDQCQEKARNWFRRNSFVRTNLLQRLSFYDFGFKLKAVDKKDKTTIEAWELNNRRELNQYRWDAWQEFLVQDAVVAIWRTSGKPTVFPVEKCEYSDAFGEERLKIRHNLSDAAIDAMKGLSGEEKAALKRGKELTLTKDNAAGKIFQFDVLKRARRGDGLGFPTMETIFTVLAQFESLEVGDNLLAGVGRDVIMQLKIGHEIKNGPHAGSKIHFCTQAKADTAVKAMKGKRGVYLLVTNFDQDWAFPRPDVKNFDAKKYDGALKRLSLWGAPLTQMVLERALNPYLMPVFKQQAMQERALMAGHLEAVFAGLNPPAPVRCAWSNRCFADARLFADMVKFGYTSGAISQTAVRDDIGYDDDEELERKQGEGRLPAAQKEPAYDPAHSKPKEAAGGRKPGTSDNP